MTITTVNLSRKIALALTASSTTQVFELWEKTPYTKPGYITLDESHTVENLTVTNYVQSLPTTAPPLFSLEDDESARQKRLLDWQWLNKRIHLGMFLEQDGMDRQQLEVISLITPKPYPYSKIELGNHPLGNNSMLSFAIQNAGSGLLQGTDRVIIHGDVISTIYLDKISDGRIVLNTIYDLTTPFIVLDENLNRTAFTIMNTSDKTIYIDISEEVSLTEYMTKIPPDTYYESGYNTPTNAIYAIHDGIGEVSVNIREYV